MTPQQMEDFAVNATAKEVDQLIMILFDKERIHIFDETELRIHLDADIITAECADNSVAISINW